jgi:hypothetical protein
MLPFAVSTSVLTLSQAAVVALPAARRARFLERLRSRGWALILPGSILAVVVAVGVYSATAEALTYLALIAVPPLAAAAFAWAARGSRPALGAVAVPLFLVAWLDRRGLAGEGAALALSALSCVTLAVLLNAIAPSQWLKWGVLLMALVDTALVVADLLQAPNNVLNAAAPGGGLPQLQKATFGSAVMGFGDLFVAAVLGAVLAARLSLQRRAALVAAALGLTFDLLFFVVHELPATVPIAVTLLVVDPGARAPFVSVLRRLAPGPMMGEARR